MTHRVRAPPLLVSPAGDNITERAPGGDVVSVVSNPVVDSDLGSTKEEVADTEEPFFSPATSIRLKVAGPSDLPEVQHPVGIMWAVGVVISVLVSTEETLISVHSQLSALTMG